MEHSNVMQMKPSTSYTIVTICTGYRFHKAANVKEEKKRKEEDMHGIVYIGDNESRSFEREREREKPKISRNLLQRI